LRILFLTAAFPSRTEPSRAPYLRDLAEGLAEHHRVLVVTPRVHATDVRRERLGGLSVQRFDHGARGRRLKPLGARPPLLLLARYASAAAAAFGRALTLRPDVVYAHWVLPTGFLARMALAGRATPLAIHLHGSDVTRYAKRSRLWAWLARCAVRRASAVLTVGEELAAWSRAAADTPVEVVPMGVDLDRFRPPTAREREAARARWGLGGDARVIAFVGDPVADKGYPALVRAVGALGMGHRLLVAGGQGTHRLDAPHGARRVVPLGRVPHHAMPIVLAAADALALPSLSEGAPLAVAEALATGLPVVATRVGAIPDLVGPEGEDLLLDPGPERELARSLAPVLRRALGESRAGQRAVPDLKDCVVRIGGVLERVAGVQRRET
jgi:teichuronic acid biosynthesis glycosyltransferase TuaC